MEALARDREKHAQQLDAEVTEKEAKAATALAMMECALGEKEYALRKMADQASQQVAHDDKTVKDTTTMPRALFLTSISWFVFSDRRRKKR